VAAHSRVHLLGPATRSIQPGHRSVGRHSELRQKLGSRQAKYVMHLPNIHNLAVLACFWLNNQPNVSRSALLYTNVCILRLVLNVLATCLSSVFCFHYRVTDERLLLSCCSRVTEWLVTAQDGDSTIVDIPYGMFLNTQIFVSDQTVEINTVGRV